VEPAASSAQASAQAHPDGEGLGGSRGRLTPEQFRERIQLTAQQADQLDELCEGKGGRNSMAFLAALKLKMEYAYPKPKQETELSGSVTITVNSPIPTRAAYLRAEAEAQHVVEGDQPKGLITRQRPIIDNYVDNTTPGVAPSPNEPGENGEQR